jgi:hypothetical protein
MLMFPLLLLCSAGICIFTAETRDKEDINRKASLKLSCFAASASMQILTLKINPCKSKQETKHGHPRSSVLSQDLLTWQCWHGLEPEKSQPQPALSPFSVSPITHTLLPPHHSADQGWLRPAGAQAACCLWNSWLTHTAYTGCFAASPLVLQLHFTAL